jgi:hypothetical protein
MRKRTQQADQDTTYPAPTWPTAADYQAPPAEPYVQPAWPTSADNGAAAVPPKGKRGVLKVVKIVGGSVVALLIVGVIISVATGATVTKVPTQQSPAGGSLVAPSTALQIPDTTAVATPPPAAPKPSDFTATVKTMSKHCYGSAGCNVVVQPDLTYIGVADLTSMTCSITYEVSGDESGPTVETGTTVGEQFTFRQSALSTASTKTKPAITITDVTCT